MKCSVNKLKKKTLLVAMSLSMPSLVLAQEQFLLEEVIVTAQKREQSLQDVPVSVSVVSGDAIAGSNMTNLDELSMQVPNLSIAEGSQTTSIVMRGLGSGINQGFEQSVGLFIDGIYAGRDRQFRSPFLDIASVEVLRGPQGTLFGKNTIAGALNLTTVKPTEEFEASIRTTYEPEYNDRAIEGIVSGALSNTVNARLAVKQAESDGYVYNSLVGRDEPAKTESVVRGTIVWHPSDDLDVTAKYETAKYDVDGESNIIDQDGGWADVYRTVDSNFSNNDRLQRSSGLEASENENQSFTLNANYAINDFTLTSITGYSEYEYHDNQDVDFSPLEVLRLEQEQDFEQLSQEFRLTSPLSDSFDFIAGLYYQTSELSHHKRLDSNLGSLMGGVPAVGTVNGVPMGLNPFSVASLLAPAAFVNFGTGLLPTNASASILSMGFQGASSGRVSDFEQDSETWAAFAQGTWHVQEALHLTLGLRYTKESKEATRSLYLSEYGSDNALPLSDANYALILGVQNGVFGTRAHNLQDDSSVENLSPSFKVQYDFNEDIMIYASASRAFKSGGFSESGTSDDFAGFSYDDEEALAFELGSKMHILNGRGTLNLAIFQTQYDDLQVSAFVGDKYVVGNAAEAVSQGVELDSVIRISEEMTVAASMAYLDASYEKFDNAACTLAQIEASGLTSKDCEQDLKGKSLAFAPQWAGNISLNHSTGLNKQLRLDSVLAINYTGEHYLAQDLDQRVLEPSHVMLNGRIALSDPDNGWELALVGKNLSDENIRTYANDVPLMDGANFSYLAMPRTLAVQVSWNYQ